MNWQAIAALGTWAAAVATFGYLLVSVRLWHAARDSAAAANKAADAALKQAEASAAQAAVAREEFQFTKHEFERNLVPVVHIEGLDVGREDEWHFYRCPFRLKNLGNLPAHEVSWSAEFFLDGASTGAGDHSGDSAQLLSNEHAEHAAILRDHAVIQRMHDQGWQKLAVKVTAHYLEHPDSQQPMHSYCYAEFDKAKGRSQVARHRSGVATVTE